MELVRKCLDIIPVFKIQNVIKYAIFHSFSKFYLKIVIRPFFRWKTSVHMYSYTITNDSNLKFSVHCLRVDSAVPVWCPYKVIISYLEFYWLNMMSLHGHHFNPWILLAKLQETTSGNPYQESPLTVETAKEMILLLSYTIEHYTVDNQVVSFCSHY